MSHIPSRAACGVLLATLVAAVAQAEVKLPVQAVDQSPPTVVANSSLLMTLHSVAAPRPPSV